MTVISHPVPAEADQLSWPDAACSVEPEVEIGSPRSRCHRWLFSNEELDRIAAKPGPTAGELLQRRAGPPDRRCLEAGDRYGAHGEHELQIRCYAATGLSDRAIEQRIAERELPTLRGIFRDIARLAAAECRPADEIADILTALTDAWTGFIPDDDELDSIVREFAP
jgi:hypothetical protein